MPRILLPRPSPLPRLPDARRRRARAGRLARGHLTRAKELEALADSVRAQRRRNGDAILAAAIQQHLEARARRPTRSTLDPKQPFRSLPQRAAHRAGAEQSRRGRGPPAQSRGPRLRPGSDALTAPARAVPSPPDRPAAPEFEAIIGRLGIKDPPARSSRRHQLPSARGQPDHDRPGARKVVTIVRGASSAGLREHIRLRSFRKSSSSRPRSWPCSPRRGRSPASSGRPCSPCASPPRSRPGDDRLPDRPVRPFVPSRRASPRRRREPGHRRLVRRPPAPGPDRGRTRRPHRRGYRLRRGHPPDPGLLGALRTARRPRRAQAPDRRPHRLLGCCSCEAVRPRPHRPGHSAQILAWPGLRYAQELSRDWSTSRPDRARQRPGATRSPDASPVNGPRSAVAADVDRDLRPELRALEQLEVVAGPEAARVVGVERRSPGSSPIAV